MKIIVTGAAGFIGFHLCKNLLKNKKITVMGIDSINSYYSRSLKKKKNPSFKKKQFYF
jgi:UDP-glucuronate 4-epimerase